MKNSLDHLPKNKQTELQKIAQTIRENCSDVEKIILFGSYARGNYKEEKDIEIDSKSGHPSDYDILVVTSTKDAALDANLWRKISNLCRDLATSASPRIISHDIEALNIKLTRGQYFFSDIKKDGILLYDSGKFELENEGKLTSKERQRVAKDHFDEWFESAQNFYNHFKIALQDRKYKISAFFLHQVAESSYKAILLVFSNYIPREHFLKILGSEAEQYCVLLQNIFTKTTRDEEDRFKLLEYAYIGGRYDPWFLISEEELKLLEKDVQKLLLLTEEICKEKIGSFV